ncbi:hypothetical protein F5Y19DRAFT_414382 [Xylariaceae sp. FL1651]|nr:hypothetical protein F5Y19DRAFT_414382 [Xylariaceae sp. FL1651]
MSSFFPQIATGGLPCSTTKYLRNLDDELPRLSASNSTQLHNLYIANKAELTKHISAAVGAKARLWGGDDWYIRWYETSTAVLDGPSFGYNNDYHNLIEHQILPLEYIGEAVDTVTQRFQSQCRRFSWVVGPMDQPQLEVVLRHRGLSMEEDEPAMVCDLESLSGTNTIPHAAEPGYLPALIPAPVHTIVNPFLAHHLHLPHQNAPSAPVAYGTPDYEIMTTRKRMQPMLQKQYHEPQRRVQQDDIADQNGTRNLALEDYHYQLSLLVAQNKVRREQQEYERKKQDKTEDQKEKANSGSQTSPADAAVLEWRHRIEEENTQEQQKEKKAEETEISQAEKFQKQLRPYTQKPPGLAISRQNSQHGRLQNGQYRGQQFQYRFGQSDSKKKSSGNYGDPSTMPGVAKHKQFDLEEDSSSASCSVAAPSDGVFACQNMFQEEPTVSSPSPDYDIKTIDNVLDVAAWVQAWAYMVPSEAEGVKHWIDVYSKLYCTLPPSQFEMFIAKSRTPTADGYYPVVGTGYIHCYEGVAAIHCITVRPSWRYEGVGGDLLQFAKQQARNKGYNMAMVTATDAGLKMLRKANFRDIGRVKLFVFRPRRQPPPPQPPQETQQAQEAQEVEMQQEEPEGAESDSTETLQQDETDQEDWEIVGAN